MSHTSDVRRVSVRSVNSRMEYIDVCEVGDEEALDIGRRTHRCDGFRNLDIIPACVAVHVLDFVVVLREFAVRPVLLLPVSLLAVFVAVDRNGGGRTEFAAC